MSKERPKTILPDFLELLGVRHTTAYSDSRLQSMPFKTLFGLQQLLRDYGVESEAWALSDKTEITALLLSLNALMPAFDRNPKDTDNGK